MKTTLHELIGEKGFEQFRQGLEARFGAHRLAYTIHYGETPPNCSIFIRLESKQRIGEVCAWESGDCDVHQVDLQKEDGIQDSHYTLASAYDFHDRIAALFLFVAQREPKNQTEH